MKWDSLSRPGSWCNTTKEGSILNLSCNEWSQNTTNDPVKENAERTSRYIRSLHLTSTAIWQTHAWHGAQRRRKDNRCHPKHTIPPLWAWQGYIKKKKDKCTPREQTGTMLHLVSHGLAKALHKQAQMPTVHITFWCLGLITNTYRKMAFGIFCHLPSF